MLHFADDAAPVAAIDPTLLALLSIFGGALLAAVAGLIGAWIQSRREHRAWLREKRFEAFVSVRVLMRTLHRYVSDRKQGEADGDDARATAARHALLGLQDSLAETMAPMVILGPTSVHEAGIALTNAIHDGQAAEIEAAESEFVSRMQQSLVSRE